MKWEQKGGFLPEKAEQEKAFHLQLWVLLLSVLLREPQVIMSLRLTWGSAEITDNRLIAVQVAVSRNQQTALVFHPCC